MISLCKKALIGWSSRRESKRSSWSFR